MSLPIDQIKSILEAAILSSPEPVSQERLTQLFAEGELQSAEDVLTAIQLLQEECQTRGITLQEVATGYRFHVNSHVTPWLARWLERPARYSRALLETLALIAYRQPISRAEIEATRGVAVGSSIIRTLLEREWIKIVGHRDVPGRPALFGTTKAFLDYFNLTSLTELPVLPVLPDGGAAEEQEITAMMVTENHSASSSLT